MESSHQRILKAIFLFVVLTIPKVNSEKIEIVISHCNDINGQIPAFEPGTHNSSNAPKPCTETDDHKCIGGVVNVVHWLYEVKGDDYDFEHVGTPNLLRLSTGNLIGGESGWIASIGDGWKRYATLVKQHIEPTFTALGMKEFGAGLSQTITFVEAIGGDSTGIVNTCIGDDYEGNEKKLCDLAETSYKTISLENNNTIGVLGFVNPNVERLSLPGKLNFSDVADNIKRITEQQDITIKTFIAVGDGNLEMAKKILDEAPKVKLVIYGAGLSNTNIGDEYPLPYKNRYIASAGRYGSSVGKIHLELDTDTGEFTAVKGAKLQPTTSPKELNTRAKDAQKDVSVWQTNVTDQMNQLVGNTRVPLLGGETCWREECNIGNLMTDAVVHCVLNRFDIEKPFPNILHSIWHGGAFFEDTVNGTISEFDVHKWLPYHNNVHLVKVKGSDLIKVFEASATGIDPEKFEAKDWRQFLQVSNGFQVSYDTTATAPKVNVRIVHDDNGVPGFADLDTSKEYHLAIPTYLYEGRGVYGFAKDFWTPEEIPAAEGSGIKNVFDDECLEGYIRAMKHISVGLEERIWVNKDNEGGSTEAPGTDPTTPTNPTTTTPDGTGTSGSTTGNPCPTLGPSPPPYKPCPKKQKTAVTVTLTIVFYTIILAIGYVGYFYVLPRLRRPPLSEQYPPNQL